MKTVLTSMGLCGIFMLGQGLAAPMPALIIDGQSKYHDWKAVTPVLKKAIEQTGLFTVEVATTPPGAGPELAAFKPDFAKYKVIIMNYDGATWGEPTRLAMEKYMAAGGGLVVVHSADNAFPDWPAYNEMIAVAGWGDRKDQSGGYLRWKDGKQVLDTTPGRIGNHGAQHPYALDTRAPSHPIMKGLPAKWMHASDELYETMRGPGKNAIILATAFADPQFGGDGEQEAELLAITYGKGRIFHTMLGHGPEQMRCVGFIVTLQRGTEWAATGKVTQKVPADFPKADAVSIR